MGLESQPLAAVQQSKRNSSEEYLLYVHWEQKICLTMRCPLTLVSCAAPLIYK
jgi:hypothetical protein